MVPSSAAAEAARVGSKDLWDGYCAAFGAAVRARREHLGFSQEELEARSGLDRTYISGVATRPCA